MRQRVEYKVIELREGLLGGKVSRGKLEDLLNEHAQDGWVLRTMVSAADGLLVTFERLVE